MGRPYGTLSMKYRYVREKATCSAVGTIHFVARDFNPWNLRIAFFFQWEPLCVTQLIVWTERSDLRYRPGDGCNKPTSQIA